MRRRNRCKEAHCYCGNIQHRGVSLAVAFVYPILDNGLDEIEGMFVERQLAAMNEANVMFKFLLFTYDAEIVEIDLLRHYFHFQQ